jgi:MoxR-like ATPase
LTIFACRRNRVSAAVTLNHVADKLDVSSVRTDQTSRGAWCRSRESASISVLDYAIRSARNAQLEWRRLRRWARGGIALVRSARACALLAGRDFVTPDDIKRMALPALRHRVTPAPELQIEGQDSDAILTALLEKIDAPRN